MPSFVSTTMQRLQTYVNMDKTDPTLYSVASEGDSKSNAAQYNKFKNELDAHLQGDRGHSLLKLICADRNDLNSFDSKKVKMGFTASCPMPLRKLIIAQHDYRASECRRNTHAFIPQNDDSIRIKSLIAAILGMPLSLPFRILRLVIRTVFLPLSFAYSLHQQYRYEIDGWAKEDIRRIGWEWIDTGVTLLTLFIGIINTFHPNAIKLDGLRNYYVVRHDKAIEFNQKFAENKKQYLKEREEINRQAALIANVH